MYFKLYYIAGLGTFYLKLYMFKCGTEELPENQGRREEERMRSMNLASYGEFFSDKMGLDVRLLIASIVLLSRAHC